MFSQFHLQTVLSLGSNEFSFRDWASIVIIFLLHLILLLGPGLVQEVTIIIGVFGLEHNITQLEDDNMLHAPEHVHKQGDYLEPQILGATWLIILACLFRTETLGHTNDQGDNAKWNI